MWKSLWKVLNTYVNRYNISDIRHCENLEKPNFLA